jgi:hypothetical protein
MVRSLLLLLGGGVHAPLIWCGISGSPKVIAMGSSSRGLRRRVSPRLREGGRRHSNSCISLRMHLLEQSSGRRHDAISLGLLLQLLSEDLILQLPSLLAPLLILTLLPLPVLLLHDLVLVLEVSRDHPLIGLSE